MDVLWKLLPSLITIVFTLVIGAKAYGILTQKVEMAIKQSDRNRAYTDKEVHGMKDACGLCQGRLCGDLKKTVELYNDLDEKLDDLKDRISDRMDNISRFMGDIERFVKDFERYNNVSRPPSR